MIRELPAGIGVLFGTTGALFRHLGVFTRRLGVLLRYLGIFIEGTGQFAGELFCAVLAVAFLLLFFWVSLKILLQAWFF